MKRIFKILLFLLLLIALAVGGFYFYTQYVEPEEIRDVHSFVPSDFIFLVESDKPIDDWQELSRSKVWRYLKNQPDIADLTSSADYLDSLLEGNSLIVKFIRLGDLMISAHMTERDDYDMLFLVDMRGLSQLARAKAGLEAVFEGTGYDVSTTDYIGKTLYNLKDPQSGEVLTLCRFDNVLVGSYTQNLVKKAILQTAEPSIKENPNFVRVRDNLPRSDLYSLYLNYGYLKDYLSIYLDESPEVLEGVEEILTYSSFDFEVEDDHTYLRGYTRQMDSVPSFFNVFNDVGQGRLLAQEVLPKNTAFFVSMGFDDFDDFFERFSSYYAEQSPEEHEDFMKNKQRIENFLGISMEEDFFEWMTDEVITALVPLDESGKNYAYYGLLHFDDYELALEKMDLVAEQIRKKSPAKFLEIKHQGVPIRYLELKGFFKIFLKKMFNKIEKPHYAFVGDYVAFSNDTTSLKYLIDQYLNQNTLEYDREYDDFMDNFESRSNMFVYLNNSFLFDFIRESMDYEYKVEMYKNRDYMLAFPHLGLQLLPKGDMYQTYMYAEFEPPEEEE
jgi:hypothetical protein